MIMNDRIQLSELPELNPLDFEPENLILVRNVYNNTDYKFKVASLKSFVSSSVTGGEVLNEIVNTIIPDIEERFADFLDQQLLITLRSASALGIVNEAIGDALGAFESDERKNIVAIIDGIFQGAENKRNSDKGLDLAVKLIETNRIDTNLGFVDVADRFTIVEEDLGVTVSSVLLFANTLNNPVTGLAATRATVFNQYSTTVETGQAIASSIEALDAKIFDENGETLNFAFVGKVDLAVANAGGSIASSLQELETITDNTNANIINNYYTKTNADDAIALSTNSLKASIFNEDGTFQNSFITDIDSAIVSDDGGAIATRFSTLEAVVNDPVTGVVRNTARILDTQEAVVNETNARAGAITSLETSLGQDISATNLIAQSAQSTAIGNSQAITTIGNTANAANGRSITALDLATVAGNDISGLKATATLVAATTSGGRTRVAGMKATSTSATTSLDFFGDGIRFLKANGAPSIVFNTSTGEHEFFGDLKAVGGTFSGDLQAAGGTFSGNLSGVGGTFSGNLQAAGGTFSGNLSAVGGTFSGSLNVKSSASGQRIEILGDNISVYDSSGALRVRIGNLA